MQAHLVAGTDKGAACFSVYGSIMNCSVLLHMTAHFSHFVSCVGHIKYKLFSKKFYFISCTTTSESLKSERLYSNYMHICMYVCMSTVTHNDYRITEIMCDLRCDRNYYMPPHLVTLHNDSIILGINAKFFFAFLVAFPTRP